MKKKRVVILGAGISGLTCAWRLFKAGTDYDVILLEKGKAPGGYMKTEIVQDQVLERGPRIFKGSKNKDFLQLIREVGFEQELIASSKKAKARYLYRKGSLKKAFSSNVFLLVWALLTEWTRPVHFGDESVWDFACRRFGKKLAQRLFDPLAIGIYAGDIKKLSIRACFPVLKQWEEERKSVTAGLLRSFGRKKQKSLFSLFSFRKGVGSFIERLSSQIPFPIEYEKEVREIQKKEDFFVIQGKDFCVEADRVILALPAYEAAACLRFVLPRLSSYLDQIIHEPVTSVCVSWDRPVLAYSGIGYLVPSSEQEAILGVLFDSNIFPEQSGVIQTKMTLMLKGAPDQEQVLQLVDRVCVKHLKIAQNPSHISWSGKQSIAQYFVNHEQLVQEINQNTPLGVTLVGNYLEGVSVNDCIALACKKMKSFV